MAVESDLRNNGLDVCLLPFSLNMKELEGHSKVPYKLQKWVALSEPCTLMVELTEDVPNAAELLLDVSSHTFLRTSVYLPYKVTQYVIHIALNSL